MSATERKKITVETTIQAPIGKVWDLWTDPGHIIHWNQASDDWFTPHAENDLQVGGKFNSRMEARDGSNGFDFEGVYDEIKTHKLIRYRIEDGREVNILFDGDDEQTRVTETFEAENTFPLDIQRTGWQSILDHFKKYVEFSSKFERLRFEISIGAKAEKVYRILLDPDHYKEWTAPFNPDSHFKGNWEKGTQMIFLGTDEKGNQGGMVSRIRENIPGKYVLIEHLHGFRREQEITPDPEADEWTGATERYFLIEKNDTTKLQIDMDVTPEFKSYFMETWPRALKIIKTLSES